MIRRTIQLAAAVAILATAADARPGDRRDRDDRRRDAYTVHATIPDGFDRAALIAGAVIILTTGDACTIVLVMADDLWCELAHPISPAD